MRSAEIVAFCRARLNDEGLLAAAANTRNPGPWIADNGMVYGFGATYDRHGYGMDGALWDPDGSAKRHMDPDVAKFVADHSPARVLASIEAGRAILDEIETYLNAVPADRDARELVEVTACLAVDFLRLLASRWSWHEDYQTGWAP